MKLNFDAQILGLDGAAIEETKGKPLTFSAVAANALLAAHQDEANLPGDEKAKRFKLALRVSDGGTQELSVEEASLLKKVVARGYAPLVVGRVYEMIESESPKKGKASAS